MKECACGRWWLTLPHVLAIGAQRDEVGTVVGTLFNCACGTTLLWPATWPQDFH